MNNLYCSYSLINNSQSKTFITDFEVQKSNLLPLA